MKKAEESIAHAAETAKLRAGKVIDDMAKLAEKGADKAGQKVHDAGVKARAVAEKLIKATD